MKVTVCIPQREYGVACIVALACLAVLHFGIFAVYVAYNARVDERVIKRSVEYCLLVGCPALYAYASEVAVPTLYSFGIYIVEALACLLRVEVLACVLY